VAELAVVDEIDPGFLLVAHDIGHGILELAIESGLVELLAERAFLAEFEQFRRARQASHVRRQNPVCHFLPPEILLRREPQAARRPLRLPSSYQKPRSRQIGGRVLRNGKGVACHRRRAAAHEP
jgi:hypothetical protein